MRPHTNEGDDGRYAALEAAAARATQRRDSVLRGAMQWFAARERGDGPAVVAIERDDPTLARLLRRVEAEVGLPRNEGDRRRTFRRLHDALIVVRLTDVLGDALDATCPLCAVERDHGDAH